METQPFPSKLTLEVRHFQDSGRNFFTSLVTDLTKPENSRLLR
jgi:hypothetical protein